MKIYRCNICGKLIITLNDKDTPTICCNKEMVPLTAKEQDEITGEKHQPKVSIFCDKVYVRVGEQLHPHIDKHHIEWILLETNNGYQIRYLTPENEPTTTFKLGIGSYPKTVYSYCNIHGLWKKDIVCHKT